MPEALQDYETPAVRPVFITVLCILTFIGSGWGLISAGIKVATADTQAAAMSMTKETMNSKLEDHNKNDPGTKFALKMMDGLNMSADNFRKIGIAEGIAALLCLGGALLMWNLKRTGFYLYVLGTLLGIFGPFIIMGGSNFIAILSSVGVGFIGVIFIVLYGVNLKYMK